MKRAMRILSFENNWFAVALFLLLTVVGTSFALLPVLAAYLAGVTGYYSMQSSYNCGWEAQIMTLPISRKWLVVGRYLISAGMAVLVGLSYTLWYGSRSYSVRMDGYGLLLSGFALLLTAISLLVGYSATAGRSLGGRNVIVQAVSLFLLLMIPLRVGMNPNPIIPERVPLDLETGLAWLTVGVIAIGISLSISLRMESRREW